MTAHNTLNDLIDAMIPEVRKVFIEVMRDITDTAFIDEMIKAIEAGDADALFRATGFTPAALGPIIDAIESVYQDAGDTVANSFPARILTPTGSMTFRWDMRNPRVENDIRTNSSQMVTRLTDEAKENVRITLERGVIAGENPRAIALDIVGRIDPVTKSRVGAIIGLTNQQETWVANTQKYLETLNSKYFGLELRDKRFDSVVKKAIDTETPLPAATVNRLVTSYKNQALKFRADSVAQTEVIQSVNRAEFLAHQQLVDGGGIDSGALSKEWGDVGDSRTRYTHLALGTKYGKGNGIGLDEPFISPSGAKLLYPGDSSLGAGAAEIVNCRCRQRIIVDWIAGVE